MTLLDRDAPQPAPFLSSDGATLTLRRLRARPARGVVLLLHGASASSDTFLYPNGGIAAVLAAAGWDVWLLDWRDSCRLARQPATNPCASLDAVARHDIPSAIAEVLTRTGASRLNVVAHCMGSACLCAALAAGYCAPQQLGSVLLTTVGLFFDTDVENFMKADDGILERVLAAEPALAGVDARAAQWPDELVSAYDAWPPSWLPEQNTATEAVLRRLTFMFGAPCRAPGVAPEMLTRLPQLFGPIGIGMFMHAGQCVRRGHLAPFDASEVAWADRTYLQPGPFRALDVTLITGRDNRLWHRASIDRMYEWLRNNDCRRVHKRVLAGYGHQELFWGVRACTEVYPLVLHALSAGAARQVGSRLTTYGRHAPDAQAEDQSSSVARLSKIW